MKNTCKILSVLVAVLALLAMPAKAQIGYDMFGGVRTLVVQSPTNLLYQAAVFGSTNSPVDLRLFTGVVKIDVSAATNVPGTVVGGFQVSADATNWTALQNYAIANPTSFKYTNTYYGQTSLIVTNTYNLEGTNTVPTASTSGFASAGYILPAPFTNTAATMTLAAPNGITTIAFNVEDTPRYLRAFWNVGGTGTNVTVSATLTGRMVSDRLGP